MTFTAFRAPAVPAQSILGAEAPTGASARPTAYHG